MSVTESREKTLAAVLLLLVISLLELHSLQLIQASGYDREVVGAYGILHGTPEWRVYQNRLLGPILVQLLMKAAHTNFVMAYAHTLSLLVAGANFIVYALVRHQTSKSSTGLIASVTFAAAVIVFQDANWFYLWDAIDLSTMLAFAYLALKQSTDLRLLIPLFFVELLNRESAEFVALWIIFASLFTLLAASGDNLVKGRMFIKCLCGLALLGFGSWWTHWIRSRLFHHSFDPRIGLDLFHRTNGEHLTLFYNFASFTSSYNPESFMVGIIANCAIGYFLYKLLATKGLLSAPLVFLILAMVSAVWTFGVVAETRVWLEFVPFLVLFFFGSEGKTNAAILADSETETGLKLAA